MKSQKTIFAGLIVALMFTGCAKTEKTSLEEMFKTEQKRQEVYDHILTNKQHSEELMKQMLKNTHCRSVAAKNGLVTRMVCLSPAFDSLVQKDRAVMESISTSVIKKMETDTMACGAVCGKMMKNPLLKQYMNEKACSKFCK